MFSSLCSLFGYGEAVIFSECGALYGSRYKNLYYPLASFIVPFEPNCRKRREPRAEGMVIINKPHLHTLDVCGTYKAMKQLIRWTIVDC